MFIVARVRKHLSVALWPHLARSWILISVALSLRLSWTIPVVIVVNLIFPLLSEYLVHRDVFFCFGSFFVSKIIIILQPVFTVSIKRTVFKIEGLYLFYIFLFLLSKFFEFVIFNFDVFNQIARESNWLSCYVSHWLVSIPCLFQKYLWLSYKRTYFWMDLNVRAGFSYVSMEALNGARLSSNTHASCTCLCLLFFYQTDQVFLLCLAWIRMNVFVFFIITYYFWS